MMCPECPNMECPIIRKHRLSTPRLSDWPERQGSEVGRPRYCGPRIVVAAISGSAAAIFACEIRKELPIRRQVALLRVHASTKPLTAGELIPFRIPECQTPPFSRTPPHHDSDRRFACEQHEVPASVRKKWRKIGQPVCGSHRISLRDFSGILLFKHGEAAPVFVRPVLTCFWFCRYRPVSELLPHYKQSRRTRYVGGQRPAGMQRRLQFRLGDVGVWRFENAITQFGNSVSPEAAHT